MANREPNPEKLELYEITATNGETRYKVFCYCSAAPEICDRTGSPVFMQFKLSNEFRQWLFAHASFLIKVKINYNLLTMEFPCTASAMAFKFRWVGA